MIDCKISFFWEGRMSWMRYMTLVSFRKLNPNWKMYLYHSQHEIGERQWSSNERDDREYVGKDYRPMINKLGVIQQVWVPPICNLAPAHRSDLFRWFILKEQGGFYSDMDLLWIRPLDKLMRQIDGTDVMFCLEDGWMAIGFHAATAGCRLMKDIYDDALENGDPKEYQGFGTDTIYRFARLNPYQCSSLRGTYAIEQFRRKYQDLRITVVPDEVVYPFDWRKVDSIFQKDEAVSDKTFGIHWFGGHQLSQKWNGLLTERCCGKYKNTFTRYAGQMT